MANPLSVGLKTAAKELYLQGVTFSKISDTLSIKQDTCRKWAKHEQWGVMRQSVALVTQKIVSPKLQAMQAQGDRSKAMLMQQLEASLSAFTNAAPLTVAELLDNEGRKARIDGLKALADIGVIAHGWGKDSGTNGLVGYARVSESFIDVSSVESTEPAQVEPSPCMDVKLTSIDDSPKPVSDSTLEK